MEQTHLIGLALPHKTTNENGQSNIDCGGLWQKFEKGGYFNKIPGKKNNEIRAVYYQYEGDHTQPFSYFIGCEVEPGTVVPEGLDTLSIPDGKYQKFIAKGEMPGCIGKAWKEIWESDVNRAYTYDFEIYDERSSNWSNAEVDIFIATKS